MMPVTPEQIQAATHRLETVDRVLHQAKDSWETGWAQSDNPAVQKAMRWQYKQFLNLAGQGLDHLFDDIPALSDMTNVEYTAVREKFKELARLMSALVQNIRVAICTIAVDEEGKVLVNLSEEDRQLLRDDTLRLRNRIKAVLGEMP